MPTHDMTPHKIGIMTEDGFHELNAPSIEAVTLETETPEVVELERTIINSCERQFEMSFEIDKNQLAELVKELQPKHGEKLTLKCSCVCDGTLEHATELIRKLEKRGCVNISVRSEIVQNKECQWMNTKFTATGIFWNTNNWRRIHGVPMVRKGIRNVRIL